MPEVVSIRQEPGIVEIAIRYIQSKWVNENSMAMYDDCIRHALTASGPLPQWVSSMGACSRIYRSET